MLSVKIDKNTSLQEHIFTRTQLIEKKKKIIKIIIKIFIEIECGEIEVKEQNVGDS